MSENKDNQKMSIGELNAGLDIMYGISQQGDKHIFSQRQVLEFEIAQRKYEIDMRHSNIKAEKLRIDELESEITKITCDIRRI